MEVEIWEIFKDSRTNNIKNTRGALYEISNKGRAKKNGKLIKLRKNNSGYLCCGGIGFIHIAVAKTFIPNPENKPEVDHIDGDKNNNNIENLRWLTHKENINNPNTKRQNFNHKETTKQIMREKKLGLHREYYIDNNGNKKFRMIKILNK